MALQDQKALEERIRALIAPTIERMGYELWGVRWLPGNRILRIYIDLPGGVTLADCERVSRRIERLLDLEDPIPFSYHLEVSSPGWDRPLFTPEQFRRFLGQMVRLVTKRPISGRRRFRGLLLEAREGELLLEQDGERVSIPFEEIDKAWLVPEPDRKP